MLIRFLPVLVTLVILPAVSSAQEKFPLLQNGGFSFGPAQEGPEAARPDVSAKLVQLDAVTVELQVTVAPPDGFYIYSMHTEAGQKTKITLSETAGLEPSQQGFTPDHPPKSGFSEVFRANEEKFLSPVTWSQQLKAASPLSGVIRVSGSLKGQICSTGEGGTCVPLRPAPKFTAELTADESLSGPAPTEAKPADSSESVEVTAYQKGVSPDSANLKYIVSLTPASAAVGDEVSVSIRAEMKEHWHTYSNTQSPDVKGGYPTRIELLETAGLSEVDNRFRATTDFEKMDGPLGGTLEIHSGTVTWQRRFLVTDPDVSVSGVVNGQICNEKTLICELPGRASFQLTLGGATSGAVAAADSPAEAEGSEADKEQRGVAATARKEGLLFFLLAAAGAGFVALLTPCVFPMIPVTVAFFLKQEESGKANSKVLAVIYCLGIIGTFTVVGVLVSAIFGQEAMTELANGPWLNLLFALVFVVFGLMLLGVFELRVPTALLNWSAQREGQGGVLGVLFMALTFTLVSFTCTAAFVAGLLVEAATGDYLWPTLGMLAFSTAFASPFFLLALFPGYLSRLPKSGGWMNKVKCTAGLIELAFVVKFLSVADIGFSPTATPRFLDFSTTMVLWATVSFVIGLYLLGIFRFDKDTPTNGVSPIGALFGMSSIGLGLIICVGLFSPMPPNNWVWNQLSGFAPPQFHREITDDRFSELAQAKNWLSVDGLAYALEADDGVRVAQVHDRPLFIDFTGVNCVNCRAMEKSVMNQPQILDVLATVPRAQLYLDQVPGVADEQEEESILDRNYELCIELTGGAAMPTYVVLAPDGKTVLSSTTGLVSLEDFEEFLETGLRKFEESSSNVAVEEPRRDSQLQTAARQR